jgi:hypothetical protein
MKPKLKIKIVPFENAVAVQVLEMDERFRCRSLTAGCHYYSDNGFVVESHAFTYAEPDKIYLRGTSKQSDNNIATLQFSSNAERDKWIDRCTHALRQWAKNWRGFGEPTKKKRGFCL